MTAVSILEKVEQLKDILVGRATGKSLSEDSENYAKLRRDILAYTEIQEHLPDFVKTRRTLDEFWQYIKPQFGTYQERREHIREGFGKVLFIIEQGIQQQTQGIAASSGSQSNLFQTQFPAGLPFGIRKPSIAIRPFQGQQRVYFEDESDIGVIRSEVYPGLTFQQLNQQLTGKPIIQRYQNTFAALLACIQTPSEIAFFTQYTQYCDMLNSRVPVLIPQAWIQWHSKTKQDLRSQSSAYAEDLYRVDFVIFWNNKRYAVLIDDISHYARKANSDWKADQELYSKRLKEDRKLRKEGWEVFRTSNWETRTINYLHEILQDLRETVEF